MKNNTLVTIGIPFYNASEYLELAIRSILSQTYENWELILLDDGSSDNSVSIATKFDKDPRVRVISDYKNKGLPYRLNQISALAKGEYYARMDADDILHPERIKIQVEYLLQNPGIDVVGTAAITIDSNNFIIGSRSIVKSHDFSIKTILRKGLFIHPSIMGATTWFKNNPYDERAIRIEDLELWIASCDTSIFSLIDLPCLFYRDGGESTLKKYIANSMSSFYVVRKHWKKIGVFYSSSYFLGKISKMIVYMIADQFNFTERLVRITRSDSILDDDLKKYQASLDKILEQIRE